MALLLKENNCAKLLGQIRMDALAYARTYARMHIHRTKIVKAMSRFTASGLDRNYIMWLNI